MKQKAGSAVPQSIECLNAEKLFGFPEGANQITIASGKGHVDSLICLFFSSIFRDWKVWFHSQNTGPSWTVHDISTTSRTRERSETLSTLGKPCHLNERLRVAARWGIDNRDRSKLDNDRHFR